MILHILVSSAILLLALAAAKWIRPLTARTRHAILLAGMASLFVPSTLIATAIERSGTRALMPIRMTMPVAITALPAAPAPTAPPWTAVIIAAWLAVATALLLRSLVITFHLTSHATRVGLAPPPRTIAALDAARHRLGLHTSIDLIASPTCEAPAVVRFFRPLLILPADGCQSLDDDELESLLCHECAHVARRDNLVGLFEAIAGAVFWFNPLVWLARRRIAAAREEACDERVADANLPAETYVGALAKLCRALVAPRVAAVSCMANAHLKERIEHLMRYDSLRNSALSHRLITVLSSLAVLALVLTGGVVAASPGRQAPVNPYVFNVSIARIDERTLTFLTDVVDANTKQHYGTTTMRTQLGAPVSSELSSSDKRFRIDADVDATGAGTLTLVAWVGGAEVQRTSQNFPAPKVQEPPARSYSGEPISMHLANADIRDVLRTFGKLTGLEITVDPGVTGVVNVNFTDMPWDQALDQVLRENGLTFKLDGNKMHVFRAGS